MAVRIRLSRGGSKKRPFYRIVAADSRAPRDGRFIEKLGTYNPMLPQDHEQRVVVNADRIQYWLGIGAQPTERLTKLFANLGLTKAPVLHEQPKKSAPKAKAVERMKAKDEAAKAAAEAAKAAEEAAKAAAEAPAAEAEAPAAEAPAENSENSAE
ncbi:MAG: 30S ribosomal protein S16 [Alphaproteobacteria bacterium]|nr:30S ribosomal protein S16 [Alphaproteobacteria bacterium]